VRRGYRNQSALLVARQTDHSLVHKCPQGVMMQTETSNSRLSCSVFFIHTPEDHTGPVVFIHTLEDPTGLKSYLNIFIYLHHPPVYMFFIEGCSNKHDLFTKRFRRLYFVFSSLHTRDVRLVKKHIQSSAHCCPFPVRSSRGRRATGCFG
jgi:hypothetical protein